MQKTLTINDTLLENASKCVGLDDVNEVVNMALQELISSHKGTAKRRQPPISIAGKGKVIGDLTKPCVDIEDFECLK